MSDKVTQTNCFFFLPNKWHKLTWQCCDTLQSLISSNAARESQQTSASLENVMFIVKLVNTASTSYLHDTPLYSLLRSNRFLALAPVPAWKQRTNKLHTVLQRTVRHCQRLSLTSKTPEHNRDDHHRSKLSG